MNWSDQIMLAEKKININDSSQSSISLFDRNCTFDGPEFFTKKGKL